MIANRMKLQLCCLLSLFFLAKADFAFALIPDSASVSEVPLIIAWPDTLHPELYRKNLLHVEEFNYDVLISRFDYTNKQRSAGDNNLSIPAFSSFLNLHSNSIVLDTAKATSFINVQLGSKREQLFFIDHRQRISRHATIGISYNSCVSEGFLIHQYTKAKAFDSDLEFAKGRYEAKLEFEFHKVEADENGGILPGQLTYNISKSDFPLLKVNLTDATSRIRTSNVLLNQNLKLYTNQGKMFVYLDARTSYSRIQRSYKDTPDTTYYAAILMDSIATSDTLGLRNIAAGLDLRFSQQIDSSKKSFWSVSFGADWHEYRYMTDSMITYSSLISPVVKAQWISSDIIFHGEIRTVTTDNHFEVNDKYSLMTTFDWKIGHHFLNKLSASFYSAELAPALNQQYLISNHFSWTGKNLKHEIKSVVVATLDFWKDNAQIYGSLEKRSDPVYYNFESYPVQFDGDVSTQTVGLTLMPHFHYWYLFADVKAAHSDNVIVPVPDYRIFGRLSYKKHFFKSAMIGEFGVSYLYTSVWNANAYQPATGQYYLNSGWKIGGQPCVNFFTNIGIGKAVLMIQIENFGHGWLGKDLYAGPGYPVPPRTFKFGLRWLLKN
jgi:hypothetical protein